MSWFRIFAAVFIFVAFFLNPKIQADFEANTVRFVEFNEENDSFIFQGNTPLTNDVFQLSELRRIFQKIV